MLFPGSPRLLYEFMSRPRKPAETALDFDQMYRAVTKVTAQDPVEPDEENSLALVPYSGVDRVVPRGTVMVTHARPHKIVRDAKGKKTKRKNLGYVPNTMPMLPAEPTMRHTFRFKRNGSNTLYRVDLQDLYQVVVAAGASNYVRPIFRTFKVLQVVVRGSIAAVGETATVSIRYEGTNTNQQKYMDSTNKVDVNAMVHRKPPRFSLASFWQDVRELDSSQVLFEIEYFGAGECYLDIHMQAVLDCNGDVNFAVGAGNVNQPGRLYSVPIGDFQPVGIIMP